MDPRTDLDPNKQPLPISVQRRISDSEIVRFFETVCKDAVCEMCRSSAWKASLPPEKYSVISAIGDGEKVSILTPRGHVTLNIYCGVCGNIKFLLAEHVERWIKDHPSSV